MQARLRSLTRALAGLGAALLLPGCIDGREEVWVRGDGGGVAEVEYRLPARALRVAGGEAATRRQLAEFLATEPAFTATSHELRVSDGEAVIRVRVEFDSALELGRIAERGGLDKLPPPARHLVGEVRTRVDGRVVTMRRKVVAARALPGSFLLPPSSLEGRRLVQVIHFPRPVRRSNATRVENGGRTLVWERPLEQALREPMVSSFEARFPFPGWMLAGAVVGGLLLVGGMAALVLRLRRGVRLQR